MVICLGAIVQLCYGEGGTLQQISLACVGSVHSVSATLGLHRLMVCVLSQSILLRLQVALQGVGPGLRAPPSSKPLRFRFLGSPRRHRLSWACVLCPSEVQEAQATRCLASAHSPGGEVHIITSPVPATWFPGCTAGAPSQVCHVSPLGS